MDDTYARITLNLPRDGHRNARVRAALAGRPLSELIREALASLMDPLPDGWGEPFVGAELARLKLEESEASTSSGIAANPFE